MRRWTMLLLVILPAAAGQAMFTDPAGDHEMGYTAENSDGEPLQWMAASDAGFFPYADVLEVGFVEETETDIVFRLKLAAWEPGPEPEPHDRMEVGMPFTFHGEAMEAVFDVPLHGGEARFYIGAVEEYNFGQTTYRYVRPTGLVLAQRTDDGLVAAFPKERLLDSQLVPARAGDVLQGLTVRAEGANNWGASPCVMFEPAGCWRVRDVVEGTADIKLEKNPPGVGHLLLASDAPLRASNGEATTYLFNVTLRNIGQIDDRVLIQVGGQPSDWTIHAPSTMELPQGETATVPIAVSVPFKHKHGEQQMFEVRVASTSIKGIEAVQELGVVWHEVPQPGGHHSLLYLHGDGRRGWINALAEDGQAVPDAEITSNGYSRSSGPSGSDVEMYYRLPLSPSLLMGLDFAPEGTIRLEVPVVVEQDMAALFGASVVLSGEAGDTIGRMSQDMEFTAGSNPVAVEFPLADGVDRFAYNKAQNLFLEISLAYHVPDPLFLDFAPAADPVLSTDGAWLELPLQEYHDIIDADLLASLSRLSLRSDGETARLANPGKTVAVPFVATNADKRGIVVDWHIEGTNSQWASVVPAASDVPARGNASVLVTVQPPEGTANGQVAQLLLIGKVRGDPDVQVFGRMAITVSTSADIPDEADQAKQLADVAKESAAKKSPGLGIVALVAAVAVAVLAARRR